MFSYLHSLHKDYAGLYPVFIDPRTGRFGSPDRITFGSLADSFYEYLLKLYLLSGQSFRSVACRVDECDSTLEFFSQIERTWSRCKCSTKR